MGQAGWLYFVLSELDPDAARVRTKRWRGSHRCYRQWAGLPRPSFLSHVVGAKQRGVHVDAPMQYIMN